MRFPIRRAGQHDRFFSAAMRFAYARRFIHVGVDEPVYPGVAEAARRGMDAIERGDMEEVFLAWTSATEEVRRILAGKPAARRRHFWRQLSAERVWDGRRSRRLSYEEKVQAMMCTFGVSRRQVERDISKLPDKKR
jgi:hypothetical protein